MKKRKLISEEVVRKMRFRDAIILNVEVQRADDAGTVTFESKYPSQFAQRRHTKWAYFDKKHLSGLEKLIDDNIPADLLVYRYLRKYKMGDEKEIKTDFIDKIITITI